MRNKRVYLGGYLFTMALLTYLSMAPITTTPLPTFSYFDKLAHAGFYFMVSFLWGLAFVSHPFFAGRFKQCIILGAFFHFIYGMVIELIQASLIPGRFGEWEDLLANTAGILAASILIFQIVKKKAFLN